MKDFCALCYNEEWEQWEVVHSFRALGSVDARRIVADLVGAAQDGEIFVIVDTKNATCERLFAEVAFTVRLV